VRRHTLSSQSLLRFLDTLGVPIVATLRDSQNYVRAAEQGLGLDEMNPRQTAEDLPHWESLYEWLDAPAQIASAARRSEPAAQLRFR
jgi:chromosome partitioning protein